MIGKAPRWVPVVVGVMSIIWIVPLIGIVVTSVRPASRHDTWLVAARSF